MRREGRPHGMVRTYHVLPAPLNPKPASRILNQVDVPPTAGLFTKIPNKPTNHSKFTGKCEKVRCSGCHLHPASKSKDKSKGAQKLKSSDAAVNYQQVTFRVVGLNKLRNFGYSASGILDQLSDYHDHDYDDDDDDDVDVDENCDDSSHVDQGKSPILVEASHHHDNNGYDVDVDVDVDENCDDSSHVDQGKRSILVEASHHDDDNVVDVNKDDDHDDHEIVVHVGVTDDGDDGYVGFYDVAYLLNPVDEDEEGWSVIG